MLFLILFWVDFYVVFIAGIGSMGITTGSITIIDYNSAVIVDFKSVMGCVSCKCCI